MKAHRLTAALVAVLALWHGALATTYLERTPEELVLAADHVFVASVEGVEPDLSGSFPFTAVTFGVEEWLAYAGRGTPANDPETEAPSSVTLTFLGGASQDGSRLIVGGVPQFQRGQRVLVLAYDAPGLASPVVGVRQGVFTLDLRGARAPDGSYLSVPAAGRLTTAASGAGVEEVLEAIRSLIDEGPPQEALPVADEAQPPTREPELEPAPEEAPEPEPEPEPAPELQPEPEPDPEPESEPEQESEPAPEPEPEQTTDPSTEPAAPQPTSPTRTVRYRVDDSGGPLFLSDAVARAAAAWQDAMGGTVELVSVGETTDGAGSEDDSAEAASAEAASRDAASTEAAPHLIRYGDAALFGPDGRTFTLVRPGTGVIEVLVNPAIGAQLDVALLHDLGVLLGLPDTGAGLDPAGSATTTLAPSANDVTALSELLAFRAEDINRDGVVDFYDLAALGAAFGNRGVNLAADLNGDGVVDQADLELLRGAYEFLPPADSAPR